MDILIPLSLQPATLVRRYKRFLADVTLPHGECITIHCPNTGSMRNCGEVGDTVFYSTSDNPKRKYAQTWELSQNGAGELICVNTQRANQVIAKAITDQKLPRFADYQTIRREVPYGEKSRIDLLLQQNGLPDCYIEIKSCTLKENEGDGYFPDAVTTRGQKHLTELMTMKQQGARAVLLFAVMHSGIERVRPAAHIDPDYAQLLCQAARQGVEVLACRCYLSMDGLGINGMLPVEL